MIGCRLLANYCFIIHLDGCVCSFCCGNNFMMIMTFSMKLVNNKVADNLLIYLELNFHSHRPYDHVYWIVQGDNSFGVQRRRRGGTARDTLGHSSKRRGENS